MHETNTKILDPVCGMTVDPGRAAAHVHRSGKDFHFCSKGCAAKFESDPERYLRTPGSSPMAAPLVNLGAPASTPPPEKATVYVCPMDPEIRSSKPGACPKCGM